jgi:hypothetical protein
MSILIEVLHRIYFDFNRIFYLENFILYRYLRTYFHYYSLTFDFSLEYLIMLKNQMRRMFCILVRDSIILIFFLFFYQGLFSPDSSHSMTDQSHSYNADLFLFIHTLFV